MADPLKETKTGSKLLALNFFSILCRAV